MMITSTCRRSTSLQVHHHIPIMADQMFLSMNTIITIISCPFLLMCITCIYNLADNSLVDIVQCASYIRYTTYVPPRDTHVSTTPKSSLAQIDLWRIEGGVMWRTHFMDIQLHLCICDIRIYDNLRIYQSWEESY